MGVLRRPSQRSQQEVWSQLDPHVPEERIDYAHVRSVDGVRATLFLTNTRLAVRIHQPGYPPGSGYDVALSKIIGVCPIADEPEAFSIAGRDKSSGEVVCVAFFPQRGNRASFLRHVKFCRNLIAELRLVHDDTRDEEPPASR